MDAFSMNYVKPRSSNNTNSNASIITNKHQAQMIFTGYERQIKAISQKAVQRPAIVFSGTDGPAVNNLKNGNTWTNPATLNAIQNTNYLSNSF
jgi:hypothetical protein